MKAELIQQRAKDAWTKAMPKGMNSNGSPVSPKTPFPTDTAIEFSVASNGRDRLRLSMLGQLNLDRMGGLLSLNGCALHGPRLPNRAFAIASPSSTATLWQTS